MSVFAGSHKHDRLPIPYGKGETVAGVSGGSFILKLTNCNLADFSGAGLEAMASAIYAAA